MKSHILLLLISLTGLNCYSQDTPIYVYDLIEETLDSITDIDFDETILSGHTEFFIGSLNQNIETLAQSSPTANIYPNTNFTYKKRATIDFEITNFPIRTSVKIFSIDNDSLKNLCSGSLISRKHVLTAAHCVVNFDSNSINQDSIQVSPIYDNGILNSQLGSSLVTKVYFIKDWSLAGEDFAILELAEDLGVQTGWIGIGFNEMNSELSDDIFYKFTYPSTTILPIDPNEYNGDSLYYNYGNADNYTINSIGINNTSGIPGESGSSIIKIVNQTEYTSYGALSLASNLNHSRINNWRFHAFKSIIENDLTTGLQSNSVEKGFTVYPNPTSESFSIKIESTDEIAELRILNYLGETSLVIKDYKPDKPINISDFAPGIYFLHMKANEVYGVAKIIKH